jgi:hypothetical protein
MSDRPEAHNDEPRVVKFRPRASDDLLGGSSHIVTTQSNEPDDFEHRMWTNVAVLGFVIALVACGIWLAVTMADQRKSQDCVLMGRRDCARISNAVTGLTPVDASDRRH